ncbi:MAG: ABC transporter ATP-binding protein [Oscillospiraceae bacterium]|nr:ABC transporter ATP-binding protein [Oscillospiraceae bacterium]
MELKIQNVTKKYKDLVAVNAFDGTLTPGIYGLLGPNGAGKTTLLRVVCALTRPTEGKVLYGNMEIEKLGAEYRKVLGFMPQNFGYYPHFKTERYLEYIASIKGLNPHYAKNKISSLLELVGLTEKRKSKVGHLSGGMRQRLGIAQALLNDPDVLILDEPTAGLDPEERVKFRNLISTISQEKITILSTHIITDVAYIASDILLMKEGHLTFRGSVDALIGMVQGKVWSTTVESCEIGGITKNYIVSNVQNTADQTELRIISGDKPTNDAVQVEPTLEDAYLFYTGEIGTAGGPENEI